MFPSVAERIIFFARVENAAVGGGQIVDGLNINPYGAEIRESAGAQQSENEDVRMKSVRVFCRIEGKE